jgi:hypothetical protein
VNIPTSPALDAHLDSMVAHYGEYLEPEIRADLLQLRRLQHEASTAKGETPVFDMDEYRKRQHRELRVFYNLGDDDPKGAA